MKDPAPRSPARLWSDDSGQLVTEWTILTATVVLPLIMLTPGMIDMLKLYFYRVAGLIALPFP